MNTKKGFTLLEVLVAISIFSIIGMGSYSLLSTVIDASAVTSKQAEQLSALQKIFILIRQDLSQISDYELIDVDGSIISSFQSGAELNSMEFVRAGRANPLNSPRSDLLSISYSLEVSQYDETRALIRYSGSVSNRIDQEVEAEGIVVTEKTGRRQELINNVEDMSVRFMGSNRQWWSRWPVENEAADRGAEEEQSFSLPLAIELILVHGHYGELRRVFSIPRGFPIVDEVSDEE